MTLNQPLPQKLQVVQKINGPKNKNRISTFSARSFNNLILRSIDYMFTFVRAARYFLYTLLPLSSPSEQFKNKKFS